MGGASLVRLRFLALALSGAGALSLVLTGVSDAATFFVPPSATPALEAAVEAANATPGANTILLEGGTYMPTKTLQFSNKTGRQTVEPLPLRGSRRSTAAPSSRGLR